MYLEVETENKISLSVFIISSLNMFCNTTKPVQVFEKSKDNKKFLKERRNIEEKLNCKSCKTVVIATEVCRKIATLLSCTPERCKIYKFISFILLTPFLFFLFGFFSDNTIGVFRFIKWLQLKRCMMILIIV